VTALSGAAKAQLEFLGGAVLRIVGPITRRLLATPQAREPLAYPAQAMKRHREDDDDHDEK